MTAFVITVVLAPAGSSRRTPAPAPATPSTLIELAPATAHVLREVEVEVDEVPIAPEADRTPVVLHRRMWT